MKDLDSCARYELEPGLKVQLGVHTRGNQPFFRVSTGSYHGYSGPGGTSFELGIGDAELLLYAPFCK